MKKNLLAVALGALFSVSISGVAQADVTGVKITEWMYSGGTGEFVEFTNLGPSAVDFTGWSFDDDSQTPGVFDLTGFGFVNPGQSVVITESDANDFRAAWGLGANIKVLGGVTNNLGRNDEINLFNGAALADRLTYGDQSFAGTIRTQNASGHATSLSALGANNVSLWVLSTVGDGENSFTSSFGDIGSPGSSVVAAVPEPETYAMMLAGLGLIGLIAKYRRSSRD